MGACTDIRVFRLSQSSSRLRLGWTLENEDSKQSGGQQPVYRN
jgi:hypothetical protein